ncbi:DivIVA domain-containing protein [Pararhodonellum marinum]|uniref:DivIVA domain-containing protein n=1 Tax=Pararhodonellum marinum TaxID=2755358 RepID=UPI00188E4FAF|nr:DivIVA domain-containing protein [Pararhodonellum marinum]
MKITPIEIRQKTFEKNFRGYDKDEVSSFLNSLSQEWERMMDDKKELKSKLEQTEKEVYKLRQVEESLFKTLKTAEDTGASMIEQATKTADLILKEAQMNADAMQNEAKNKSRNIIDSAEAKAKGVMEDLREDVASLIENYEMLMAQREIVVKNLKNLSADIQDNIEHSHLELKKLDMKAHAKLVKELSRQSSFSVAVERAYVEPESSESPAVEKPQIPTETENPSLENQEISPEASVAESESPQEKVKPGYEWQAPKKTEEKPKDQLGESNDTKAEEKISTTPDTKPEESPKKNQSGSFFDQLD